MKFEIALSKAATSDLVKRLIFDLAGAGMSYTQIARRVGVSSSTIQKLSAMEGRVPRHQMLINLVDFYQKIFSCPSYYHAKVNHYYQAHCQVIDETLSNLTPILMSYNSNNKNLVLN